MQKFLNTIITILLMSIIGIAVYILFFNKVEVERIILGKNEVTLYIGETEKMISTVSPIEKDGVDINWHSNDKSVAIVDNDGLITAIGEGETDIVAGIKNTDVSATSHVKVLVKEIKKIELSITNVNLKKDETKQIIATITPEDATYPTLKFESSNENVVTVDDNGNIKAKNDGEAVIYVRDTRGKVEAKCNVIVGEIKVESISLNKSSSSLKNGEKLELKPTISPSNATNKNVTWESSDASIVTVDQNGLVTAKEFGEATITVTTLDGKKTATCKITVKTDPIVPSDSVYKYEGITLKYYIENKKNYYLTYIWMDDPYNQIKKLDSNTATYGKIMTDDELAKEGKSPIRRTVGTMFSLYISKGMIPSSKAAVAFNSSGFYVKGIWNPPSDYYHNRSSSWFVLNEGKVIRNRTDGTGGSIMGIDSSGNLKIYGNATSEDDRKNLANKITADKVKNTFSFGPKLVENGVSVAPSSSAAQRQAICQVDSNNYIMYTSIYAVSYKQVADVFVKNKCITGFNLDGGGSTSLFYKKPGSTSVNKVKCSDSGTCRQVVEGIYFIEK